MSKRSQVSHHLFSGGFNRIINAEDEANLTNYDLTDFYINNYEENSDKNAFENKYLLCKRTVSMRDLSREQENLFLSSVMLLDSSAILAVWLTYGRPVFLIKVRSQELLSFVKKCLCQKPPIGTSTEKSRHQHEQQQTKR